MRLRDYPLRTIYRKWKSGLGPFECYMRSGPFVSLQTYDDEEIEELLDEKKWEEKYKEVLERLAIHIRANHLVIVDLPLETIISIGYLLDKHYGRKATLNLNFLFHPYGIVGGIRAIRYLLECGMKLQEKSEPAAVILIDYNRYQELDEGTYRRKFNNQYAMGEDDLPDVEMLREMGVTKIVWLTQEIGKEDVAGYMEMMKQYFETEKGSVNGGF